MFTVQPVPMRLRGILFCPPVALALVFGTVPAGAGEFPVVGWVERVRIYPGNIEIHAKMDTGAKTSSLSAPNMKRFKRNGEDWVSFQVTNRRGVTQQFEERIVRIARIRRHGGRDQRRPVVMLGVCVGKIYQVTQVNLIDRGKFNYQMLIGRRLLKGNAIVDPSRTFIAKPQCRRRAER